MTQEWVYRFNEKCAEFLGYVNTTPTDKVFSIYEKKGGEFGKLIETMSMNFHSDWNWIMQIIEKMEGEKYISEGCLVLDEFRIESFQVVVRAWLTPKHKLYKVIPCEPKTKKESVIQAIDQFIDWYNEQKK